MWIFAGRLTSYVLIFACLCLTIEIYLTASAFHVFNRRFTQIRADSIIALADPRDKASPSSGQAGQSKTACPAGKQLIFKILK